MSDAKRPGPDDFNPFRAAGGGALLHNAMDNASVPMTLLEPDGTLVYANRAFCAHFGYTTEELQVLGIAAIIHPDDSAHVDAQVKAVAQGKADSFRAERRYLSKDGQSKWVLVSAAALRDQTTGKLLYIAMQAIDIDQQKQTEAALAASEARYAFLLEGAYQGVWDDDRKTGRRYYSRMWRLMRGMGADEEIPSDHQAWLERLHPDDRRRIATLNDDELNDQVVALEYRERHRNGQYIHILSRGKAVEWFPDGKPARFIGTDTDITSLKTAEAGLQFANTLLTTAMETSPDGVLVVDANSRIISFNQRFAAMWHIPLDVLHAGDDGPILYAVKSAMLDQETFAIRMQQLYAHPEDDGHDELATRDGRVIDRHTGILHAKSGEYLGRVWFFRDITERKESEARALKAARSDALTGLANRVVFMEAVEQSIALARHGGPNFAVLYLDLDHFKDVNDTLGHPIGDDLLKAVAERLVLNARAADTVARFGGDEFAIIVSAMGEADGAALVADKLIDALSQPFFIQGNAIRSGASIGITLFGPEETGAETMLSQADLALYRAKAEGRGYYRFFTDAMTDEVRTRVTLNSELRTALDAKDQLFLMYQPQIDLVTSKVIGVEALVRWRHPQRGLLPPGLFIPVAERSGLIAALGQWVLHEACRQTRDWLDQGIAPDLTAVNLSAVQFKRSSELEEDIQTTLERTGIPGHRLELELTETVLMTASRENNDVLTRLRQLGIRLAIDDFGVGYSSLDYLRRFPADRIKLAQEFVSQITTEAGSAAIVRATIGLARELGINIIAEGIESKEQLDRLAAWGCREGQGYYFAPPLTVAQIEPLLRLGYVHGGMMAPQVA